MQQSELNCLTKSISLRYPIIEYIPFLETPHEDTPPLDFNQAPIAVAGDDKVVYDWVTLNGSASYDPDAPDGWIP